MEESAGEALLTERHLSSCGPGTRELFRADIEGLRAVAVVSVIINHLMPTALPGGFAGVDIFFVISGYLIGKHIIEDIQVGRFSFVRFYARRARRILPALAAMLISVWITGWIILTGPEFQSLGKHIAAAAVFSNNILLWSESGYFDAPSATKPLLHLWSLGIEEQFYLLVPFLLWLGARGRQVSIRWVVILSVGSMLATDLQSTPSFYLLDTRFWELGAGVILGYTILPGNGLNIGTRIACNKRSWPLALLVLALMFTAALSFASKSMPWAEGNRWQTSGLVTAFLSAALAAHLATLKKQPKGWAPMSRHWGAHRRLYLSGISIGAFALIMASLFTMTPKEWPGPQTLFPVIGAVGVIFAGPGARTNKWLALPPFAFVGSISYPLYLWHWPAIVYCRMMGLRIGVAAYLLPIAAAFLLAWITRDFVEDPVRFGKFLSRRGRAPPMWTVSAGLLIAGSLGLFAVATAGYPNRFPPALRAIANWSLKDPDAAWRLNKCYYYPGRHDDYAPECNPPKRAGTFRVLLWGDSHAAHLYPGIAALQQRFGFDVVQWTAAGCPATRIPLDQEEQYCDRRRATALRHFKDAAADVVVISSAWELYLDFGNSQKDILAAVADDIKSLRGLGIRRIVIFGPGPTWDSSLPTDIFRSMRLEVLTQIPSRFGSVSNDVWDLDAAMAALVRSSDVEYVSILKQLCNAQGCRVLGDLYRTPPDLLFRDRDHLTVSGSQLVLAAAAPQILGPLSNFHPD